MKTLNDYKILKRFESLATSILGSKVITRYIEGGIRSKISSSPSEPSLIEIDTNLLKNYNDDEIRALIFHEVAHHKWSPILNVKASKIPDQVFEAIEENRVESKIIKYIEDKHYSEKIPEALASLRNNGQREVITELRNKKIDDGFLTKDWKPNLYINTLLHLHFSTIYYPSELLDVAITLAPTHLNPKHTLTDDEINKVVKAIDITKKAILNGKGLSLFNYYRETKDTLPTIIKRVGKVWPEIVKLLDWPEKGRGKQQVKVPKCLGTKKGGSSKREVYTPNEYDKMIGQTFGRQVQTALINKRKSRFMSGLRSGKFDVKQSSRMLQNRLDIFKKRKETSRKVDYHIAIAVDHSGSMANGKLMYNAQRSCYLLYEAFKECKIRLDFYSFDEDVERLSGIDEVLKLQPRGGTETAKIVGEMAKEKPQNPNTRKINIVLTDGQDGMSKEYVKDIEKKSNSQFFGIGLDMGNYETIQFENMFENKIMVEKSENLPSQFIDLCKRLII